MRMRRAWRSLLWRTRTVWIIWRSRTSVRMIFSFHKNFNKKLRTVQEIFLSCLHLEIKLIITKWYRWILFSNVFADMNHANAKNLKRFVMKNQSVNAKSLHQFVIKNQSAAQQNPIIAVWKTAMKSKKIWACLIGLS